jgi:preprotein translocase subunit YajC
MSLYIPARKNEKLAVPPRRPWRPPACSVPPRTSTMFISPAYAQSAAGGGSDLLVQLVPILLMFVIFYLLLLRPQQQRVKQHREMVSNLRRGDTVVTSGGIIGKVTKVKDDNEIEVEIAENTRVRVIKGTVSEVRVKGEPVKESA